MSKTQIAPSDRPSALQLDLAKRIARGIVDGETGVGTHLKEEALASTFEVSRTPVRAALKLLADQGVIDYRPNAGYFVKDGADAALPDFGDAGVSGEELYRALVADRARKLLPDALAEKELLARYQVPRALLAKVLVRMAGEGLIEKRQGHGWRFLPSLGTPEAIAESYRFREVIEAAAFLEPTWKIDPAELQRSREAHERLLRALDGDNAGLSPGEFFNLNASFHEMCARFSGNRFILQAMQQQNQLRRLEEHAAFYRTDRFRASCAEHLEIISAVEANDLEWASTLMRRHLAIATPKSPAAVAKMPQ